MLLAIGCGLIAVEHIPLVLPYASGVPLFPSGLAELETPGLAARAYARKITRRRGQVRPSLSPDLPPPRQRAARQPADTGDRHVFERAVFPG